jgi:hypothetical protein
VRDTLCAYIEVVLEVACVPLQMYTPPIHGHMQSPPSPPAPKRPPPPPPHGLSHSVSSCPNPTQTRPTSFVKTLMFNSFINPSGLVGHGVPQDLCLEHKHHEFAQVTGRSNGHFTATNFQTDFLCTSLFKDAIDTFSMHIYPSVRYTCIKSLGRFRA